MSANHQPQQVIEVVRSLKEVSGILQEIGAATPAQLVQLAPRFAQQLKQQAPRIRIAQVRQVANNVASSLAQLHRYSLQRKMERAVQPTLPISISWDSVPAATAGAQATMKSPYSGQPFRVTEIECLTNVNFRFTEFNIGGIDFAEPSRSRVTYDGVVGAVASGVRGLDFPTIKARDKTRPIDANWSPWVVRRFHLGRHDHPHPVQLRHVHGKRDPHDLHAQQPLRKLLQEGSARPRGRQTDRLEFDHGCELHQRVRRGRVTHARLG